MSLGIAGYDFPYNGPPGLYEKYVSYRPVSLITKHPKMLSSETLA
jgi:hypothetical protein